MCGGQMMDLIAESTEMDIGAITRLQRLKTGEMFAFSAVAGAVLGKGSYRSYMALHNYAQELGLAFQIADALLDAQGDSRWIGKPTGNEATAGKATFVSIHGADRARAQAGLVVEHATRPRAAFDAKACPLREC